MMLSPPKRRLIQDIAFSFKTRIPSTARSSPLDALAILRSWLPEIGRAIAARRAIAREAAMARL
jgi:hypothetical protein